MNRVGDPASHQRLASETVDDTAADPGLLSELTDHGGFERLPVLDSAAGDRPGASGGRFGASDEKYAAAAVDDHRTDRHDGGRRGLRGFAHAPILGHGDDGYRAREAARGRLASDARRGCHQARLALEPRRGAAWRDRGG